MKPLRVGCPCGNIVSMVGIILFANYDIQFFGICPNCGQSIKFETTIEQLITRCDQIGESNKPVKPPLLTTPEYTADDKSLLKGMHILDDL